MFFAGVPIPAKFSGKIRSLDLFCDHSTQEASVCFECF